MHQAGLRNLMLPVVLGFSSEVYTVSWCAGDLGSNLAGLIRKQVTWKDTYLKCGMETLDLQSFDVSLGVQYKITVN